MSNREFDNDEQGDAPSFALLVAALSWAWFCLAAALAPLFTLHAGNRASGDRD